MSDWKYDDDEMLTPSEVAAIFKVDPKTVTRWAKRGRFPNIEDRPTVIRTPGGHTRIRAKVMRKIRDGELTIEWGETGYTEAVRPEAVTA